MNAKLKMSIVIENSFVASLIIYLKNFIIRCTIFAIHVRIQSLSEVKFGLQIQTCCKFLFPCLFISVYVIESKSNQFDTLKPLICWNKNKRKCRFLFQPTYKKNNKWVRCEIFSKRNFIHINILDGFLLLVKCLVLCIIQARMQHTTSW